MEGLKLVAFDLDGTLADTLPLCVAAFEQAVSPYAGRRLSETEIERTFGLNETGMVKDRRERALEEFYRVYQEMQDSCPAPFAGIVPLLEGLKEKGITVALVTGKSERSCQITLETLGMADMFADILTGSGFGNRKQDCLLSLMVQYGLSPAECVYVGDTVSDVTASRAAGVACLSAGWSSSANRSILERANPGRVYGSVEELALALSREEWSRQGGVSR